MVRMHGDGCEMRVGCPRIFRPILILFTRLIGEAGEIFSELEMSTLSQVIGVASREAGNGQDSQPYEVREAGRELRKRDYFLRISRLHLTMFIGENGFRGWTG